MRGENKTDYLTEVGLEMECLLKSADAYVSKATVQKWYVKLSKIAAQDSAPSIQQGNVADLTADACRCVGLQDCKVITLMQTWFQTW